MATTSSQSFVSNASSQTTASDIFALTSSTRSIPCRTANSTIPGRKCKVTCCSSLGPDVFARAQRNLNEKRHKEPGTKRSSWPTNGIIAEIQRGNKDKLSADIVIDDLARQDSLNHGHSGTFLKNDSSEDIHRLKYEKRSDTLGSLSLKETKSYREISHERNHDSADNKITEKECTELQISHGTEEALNAHITREVPTDVINAGKFSTVETNVANQVKDADKRYLTSQRPLMAQFSSPKDPESTVSDPVTQEDVTDTSAYGAQALTAGKINSQVQRMESCVENKGIRLKERSHRVAAQMHFSKISTLAEKNAVIGNKIFYYPESPKAGSEMEIFLNRSITSLAYQPSVLMKGAYNDWSWKSFVAELRKTNLPGDWWSYKLDVPKEAYKIDFVFFDGGDVYENNSENDFFVLVEDGMQKESFEDYLMEEKRREKERIAVEKAKEEMRKAHERKLAEAKAGEEADRIEAKRRVNVELERSVRVLQRAVKNVDGLWYFQPSEFQGGDTVKLFYNRAHSILESCKEVWIHGGYNNWQQMVSIVGKLAFFSAQGGDWWTIDVEVPKEAVVLNWVFADGPPEHAVMYDNNSYQDFHALVPKGVPANLYWARMEEQIFAMLQEERHKREEASRRKAEHTARMKAELKTRTKLNFLRSQAHVFYTDPVDVQAGKTVTFFYNPSNTILNGKPEVWLRGSFNRWTHKLGCLPPVKMLPAGNKTHLKGNIKVPLDAYMMDFVFSERGGEDGGVYDNRSGLDYHTPVIGGIAKEPQMQIVHISVEMAPIAKVGGLGDVVTSLSRAMQDLGHNVEVVLPKYDCLKYNHIEDLEQKEDFFWGGTRIKVWNGKVEGLSVHFLEPENGMFWVGCVYGRRDDGHRFGFFCNAALEFLLQSRRHPDIIHCHDWSSAPVTWLFQESYKESGLSNARVVFTIHNLEFGTALIGKAMAHTCKATTVSETYAKEVSGNPAIAPHLSKFHGIRNGIDLDIWDPYNDSNLPMSYTSEQVVEGKRAAKRELQQRLGLAQLDRPLVGIITRLTAQKGIHLIKHAIWRTLDRSGQVVLLGSAPDPRIQNDFNSLANQLHNSQGDMARLCLHYDEPLSHLIYAGADFILIPSMFEPCGLTQLTAMRYGAIPVVRRTGGLNDTVFDVDHDRDRALYQGFEPNGFSFDGTDGPAVDYALNRALSAWYDARDWMNGLCKQVMEQDWSWSRPALDYLELYYGARK